MIDHARLLWKRRSGFSPLNFGSDLALWLDPSYGVYTDRSTQLTAASSQYWSVASNATLQTGDVDFWVAGWFYVDSFLVGGSSPFSKDGLSANREWSLYFDGLGNLSFFALDGATGLVGQATLAPPSTGAWHFVIAYHDAVNNSVGISIDGGAFTTSATTGAPGAAAAPVYIGRLSTVYYDGRADSVMLGKSPVGGIAALATTIRDFLCNSGAGRVYADISAAQATAWGLVSAYDFDGDGLDAHGSNDLTAVNSPTYTAGIASGAAGDGDVVSLIVPRTGSNGTPPSYAARPIWTASAGKPYHLFDGSNDSISFGDLAAWDRGTGAFTLMFAAKGGDNADVAVAKDNYAGADNGILIARDTGAWGYWDGAALVSFGADSGAASIFTVVRSGTGAGQVSVRRNGAEITTGTDARTLSNTKALVFGDSADAGHTLNGRLGDVVFVARALTAGELAQLESWAAARQAA